MCCGCQLAAMQRLLAVRLRRSLYVVAINGIGNLVDFKGWIKEERGRSSSSMAYWEALKALTITARHTNNVHQSYSQVNLVHLYCLFNPRKTILFRKTIGDHVPRVKSRK